MDFVKAMDRVPRQLLLDVMLKIGVPYILLKLLWFPGENVLVKFRVQEVGQIINLVIVLKQGYIHGPMLFTLYAAAAVVIIMWK